MAVVLNNGYITGVTGPMFSAYYTGAQQNIANNGTAIVAFPTERFDSHGYYNNSTYKFTPLVAGYYQCYTSVSFKASSSVTFQYYSVDFYKNESLEKRVSQINSAENQNYSTSASCILYCNGSSDYVTVRLYAYGSSMSGGLNTPAYTYHTNEFSGFLLTV